MSDPTRHPAGPVAVLERLVPGLRLDEGSAAAVRRDAVPVARPDSAVLFDPGAPCHGLLVLESGAVRVSRSAEDGRELLLYRVLPGETCVLTVACLMGHAAYPARGVTEGALRGVLLPAPLFERLLAEAAEFRTFVFGSFTGRVADLLDLAAAVAFERLDRRLAALLAKRVERTGRIEVVATHADLAAEIGSVRERVSRLLEGFESRGWVELGRGRVVVRDPAALRRAAGRAD
jgi:CRP/FNR family transcriptional regulator